MSDTAIFAGGCFWCMQPGFDNTPGVTKTTVGYSGGTTPNPTYEQVSSHQTDQYEAIEIVYDPRVVTYEKLVETYFDNIDPLDAGGQFADRGDHYETVIFYASDAQKATAEAVKTRVAKAFKAPVATRILPATPFFAAEEYHQKYYEKNAMRYKAYKYGSGRVRRLEELHEQKIKGGE